MMMKEHIVDAYGEVGFVMGNGCSGGSIQQNTVASIFPGLLDGIQPSCNYPDSITTALEVVDCVLLVNFYASPDWLALQGGLTQAQINAKKTAINGHLDHRGCQSWNNAFGFNGKPGNYVPTLVIDQNTGAMASGGRAAQQLPAAGRARVRPGDQPERHALRRRRPVHRGLGHDRRHSRRAACVRADADNVGVQYGLNALRSGAITAEEFVTLNEKIGGSTPTPTALRRAASPTRWRCRSRTAPASSPAAETSASCRSSTHAGRTSRASTTSGARSPSVRASTRRTAITTTR